MRMAACSLLEGPTANRWPAYGSFPAAKLKRVSEPCLAPLTFASHSYAEFHLLMPLYVCRRWEGTLTAKEGQQLAWVRPNRLRDFEMPPADVPLISHLMALL
jgi:8-oxo-dGTP diphosphatase